MKKRNIIKDVNSDGGIAQSVEQRNHNPCVGGSNPSLATIQEGCHEAAFFVYCFVRTPDTVGGGRKKNNRCSGCFSTNGEGLSACEPKKFAVKQALQTE